jgi:hypothetical protein
MERTNRQARPEIAVILLALTALIHLLTSAPV